jgi:hypothetical protein
MDLRKTYAATWPHEDVVRDRIDEDLFLRLVRHIRFKRICRQVYQKQITYFDEDGMVYWTMGAPIEETTIVNRCKREQTYEYRLKHGILPQARILTHDAQAFWIAVRIVWWCANCGEGVIGEGNAYAVGIPKAFRGYIAARILDRVPHLDFQERPGVSLSNLDMMDF